MRECFKRRLDGVSATSALAIGLLILATNHKCHAQIGQAPLELNTHRDESLTCETEDLNHSVLVECNATSCRHPDGLDESQEAGWPQTPSEIVHIYTSRSGARLAQSRLPNLDFVEGDWARMLDINTTLYIESGNNLDDSRVMAPMLYGFGASIGLSHLKRALRLGRFEHLFGLVFDDLFGSTASRAGLSMLRLQVDAVAQEQLQNLEDTLQLLDNQIGRAARPAGKLRLIVDITGEWSGAPLVMKGNVTDSLQSIDLWAVAVERGRVGADVLGNLIAFAPGARLLYSTDLDFASDLIYAQGADAKYMAGLLIKSKPSTPYNHLKYARGNLSPQAVLLTVARDSLRTSKLGDWQNAQNLAVEMLNHLKLGSNGFIDDKSVVDVLCDPCENSDASLYSLHQDHGLHLRGPRFYAMGHFSRYLGKGSVPLETEVFTQQNMFAAHYSGFLSADKKYVVGIVLNDNEHLLPFRLAIDRRVKLVTNIEAKSFNTFLIKL